MTIPVYAPFGTQQVLTGINFAGSGDFYTDSSGNFHCSYGRLGRVTGVNLNVTGDAAVSVWSTSYVVTTVIMYNASAVPGTLLTFTLRDASGGLGNSLVGTIGTLNAVVTTTKAACIQLTPAAVLSIPQETTSTIYLNISVANGSALTASFDVYGYSLN